MRILVPSILVVVFLLPQTAIGQGTINVPGDYPFIQEAIDAAVDGDTVLVGPGTYFETINLNGKAITLQSADGPDVTTIDGLGAGTVVTCDSGEGPDTFLMGFEITGAGGYPGGGMRIFASDPTISDCWFVDNYSVAGGGIDLFDSSSSIADCLFEDNLSHYGGGIAVWDSFSDVFISECSFRYNHMVPPMANDGYGAGLYIAHGQGTLVNCWFYGNNTAGAGGAIYNWHADLTVINCSFMNNNNSTVVGVGSGSTTIVNSILWGGWDPVLLAWYSHTLTVTYSCVEGGYVGEGNISVDPLLAGYGDHHVLPGSPCIDSGSNDAAGLPPTDIDGDERIICDVVDIGADEFDDCPIPFVRGDCNADGVFGIGDPIFELSFLFGFIDPTTCDDACDLNDDGTVNIADAVYALVALFVGGPQPPAPHPSCGADPTADTLDCASFGSCP